MTREIDSSSILERRVAIAIVVAGAIIAVAVGCSKSDDSEKLKPGTVAASQPPVATPVESPFSPLPPPRMPLPGIEFYEVNIVGAGAGRPMSLNLYLPAGCHDARSLPCIFIAPAGSANHGSAIVDNDRAEHYPYVRAGFAVAAYELSGALADPHKQRLTLNEIIGPVKQFMAAQGGLANGRLAVDYVLQNVPAVNPDQLYACGHSSAADIALNLARGDKRIRACCAYAPLTDVESWWRGPQIDRLAPGYTAFTTDRSPLRHVSEFNCPVFLFHAADDSMVPLKDNIAFTAAMKAAGKQITFDRVATGDHYDSMIEEGIPRGIEFMKGQGAKPLPPLPAKSK